ncbi:roadblock/LC7 domain-containing protein [Chloracidobacterium thermophilum]|uniref:Putative distant relative of homeotic protein bithoraxoid n=1 Tax=Chloracidobacterium thermophilum (strain B) TaxID=981222 RepID=G2LIR2_CHLTF|nr:hypothetical protein [Chloracidobacterium thermophilum]AEP12280.1 putative distant relative of homeotic protein bithoraxoid [Chloracidobacterium thermophilum B]QUV78032.1 hypothetical protein J8C08_07875 [Chloracidobacterium thermophilum]
MTFSELLQGILARVEGSIGIAIMGLDGLAIEHVQVPSKMDLGERVALIATSHATLLRNTMRMSSDTGVGALNELTLMSDNFLLVVRLIGREYFLIIILNPGGNLGRARFELRKAHLLLEKEFV